MSKFLDGPAAGSALMLRRAPVFLRAVIDESTGKVDALDQMDDTPGPSERVHVYRRVGEPIHACVRPGGCYELGDYRHVPDVDERLVRVTEDWRRWVDAFVEAEQAVERG